MFNFDFYKSNQKTRGASEFFLCIPILYMICRLRKNQTKSQMYNVIHKNYAINRDYNFYLHYASQSTNNTTKSLYEKHEMTQISS